MLEMTPCVPKSDGRWTKAPLGTLFSRTVEMLSDDRRTAGEISEVTGLSTAFILRLRREGCNAEAGVNKVQFLYEFLAEKPLDI